MVKLLLKWCFIGLGIQHTIFFCGDFPCFSGGMVTVLAILWCGGSFDNLFLMMLGIGGIVFIAVQWFN